MQIQNVYINPTYNGEKKKLKINLKIKNNEKIKKLSCGMLKLI